MMTGIIKSVTLPDGTTLHLDAAQYRTAQFYARLNGISLAQAVVELLKREQLKQREGEQAGELFERLK